MYGLVKCANEERLKPFEPGASLFDGAGMGIGMGMGVGTLTGLSKDLRHFRQLKEKGPTHTMIRQLQGAGIGGVGGTLFQALRNTSAKEET